VAIMTGHDISPSAAGQKINIKILTILKFQKRILIKKIIILK